MSWQLFTQGQLFSRIFFYERGGDPLFLTPLYVASFSSYRDADFAGRALALLRSLKSMPNYQQKAQLLLSAYDLKRRAGIDRPASDENKAAELIDELRNGWYWHLDTGVYEKECLQDKTWNVDEYLSVFQAAGPPSVVAYDHKPETHFISDFEQALARSIDVVKKYLSGSSVTFLVRFHHECGLWDAYEGPDEALRIKTLLDFIIATLNTANGAIDVVGVAETELGPGIRNRVRSLARLRMALDEAGVEKPIHVFGASDPQALVLYSLAGADIFDAVNWSRYYLDVGDYCFRDGGLLSWREPTIGEPTSRDKHTEVLGIGNIFRMHQLTSLLRRFIERRRPQSRREEQWFSFVQNCCEDILSGRE